MIADESGSYTTYAHTLVNYIVSQPNTRRLFLILKVDQKRTTHSEVDPIWKKMCVYTLYGVKY